MRRAVAATAITASLAGGAFVGATLFTPVLSGAQTTPPSTGAPAPAPSQAPGDRDEWMSGALAPLVQDGTINQSQSDAVIKALQDARPKPPMGQGGHEGHEGHEGQEGPGEHAGPGRRGPGPGSDAAAKALGLTPEDLRTALQGGKTIAAVAQEKGVALQTVIDAMVADINAKIDQQVTEGHITQEEADERKADVTDRVTKMANGEKPEPPAGAPRGGPGRPGQPDQAPASPPTTAG